MTTTIDRLDGLSTSVAVKPPVKAVSSVNLTLYGEQTVNGTAVVEGDRVLVKDQTDAVENGIYNVGTTEWPRADDFDGARDVVDGTLIVVNDGTSLYYRVTSPDPIVIGEDELEFELVSGALTQEIIGAVMFPQTGAEQAASITPVTTFPSLPYDLRRAGLVPNDTGARAANTAALKALLDAAIEDGPTGWFVAPNTTGEDVYYFGVDFIQIRDGCVLDWQGCGINVSGAYDADMDYHGFFEYIRDVQFVNARTYVVDYDGTNGGGATTFNGCALRVGGRASSYGFGLYMPGLEEEDLDQLMGNCVTQDIRIITNNEVVAPVVIYGGVHNTVFRRVTLEPESGTLAADGFTYEFGQWHYVGGVGGSANISTHALNLRFEDCKVTGFEDNALHVTGAMTLFVDGLTAINCGDVFNGRPGEAMYYNMTGTPTEGMKAHYDLRRIHGNTGGIAFAGAQSSAGGYLATEIALLTADERRNACIDQISFSLEGYYLASGSIIASGRHVSITKGSSLVGVSGGIYLQDELTSFNIDQVEILDGDNVGIRSQTGTVVPAGVISAATSASPIEFTTAVDHGLTTGRRVQFLTMPGDFATPLNALNFDVTVTAVNKFTVAVNGVGFGAYTSGGTFGLIRYKVGRITNSMIAGNASHGIAMSNTASVYLGQNIIGHSLARHGEAEDTQDSGIFVSADSFGVVCDGNEIATSGGAVAYSMQSSGDRGCEIRNPQGLTTTTGAWKIDGVARDSATSIADAGHAINVTNKYTGKRVYDTSNKRMLMAQGADPTSTWITVADFGAGDAVVTVTPS